MDDWVSLLLGAVIGLATGVATGFYFERRETKAARTESAALRAHNDELRVRVEALQKELREVKLNIATTTGILPGPVPTRRVTADLPARIYRAARDAQDASGAVHLQHIRAQFCRDHPATDVDLAITALVELRRATVEDTVMRMT